MSDSVAVTIMDHRVFGRLVKLALPGGGALALTPVEAATVAGALSAVRAGRSPETTLYLSPLASDGDLTGTVGAEGVVLTIGAVTHPLDWSGVGALAAALAAAGG